MNKLLFNNKYFIDNDILIELNKIDEEAEHTHDFIEFVYMLSGKSVHKIDGYEYPMTPGTLLIINYNQVHSFNGEKQAKFFNILIKPGYIDKNLNKCNDLLRIFDTSNYFEFKDFINDKCNFIRFSPEEKNCFEYMLFLLKNELDSESLGYKITTRAGIDFLLTMIFRKMCHSQIVIKHDFNTVLDYINLNYNQNISVAYLAKMCHYNPSYFSRIFKKFTGINYSEYLKRIRINKACELIINNDININSVYSMVGYTNKTKFYKHFKELKLVTPLKYKNIQKNVI